MGDLEQGAIPIEQFQPADETTPSAEPLPQGAIPIEQFQGEDGAPTQKPKKDLSQYETPEQQFKTVAENAAQGLAGPLATLTETKLLGVNPEDIKARAQANPAEAIAGQLGGFGLGMFLGTGEARAGSLLSEALTPQGTSLLGKIGSKALSGAIQAGFFQANNEITRSLLGESDPNYGFSAALSNVGYAALTGGAFGAATGAAGAAVEKAGSAISKAGNFAPANKFLYGIGLGSQFPEEEVYGLLADPKLDKNVRNGIKAWNLLKNKGVDYGIGLGVGYLGGKLLPEEYHNKLTEYGLDALGVYLAPKVANKMGPLMYKLLSNGNIENLGAPVEYFGKAINGDAQMGRAISNVFSYGSSQAIEHKDATKDIQAIRDFIDNGGVDNQLQNTPVESPQAFAQGGEVKQNVPVQMNNGIAAHLPEQNMLLSAAKMRISNYLASQSPKKNVSKLPFDSDTKNPEQERDYNHTLMLAARPLEILNHVKKGNLTPKIMAKFTAMYPEIYDQLSKRMTKTITEMQFKNEKKPPYQLRQSLSLFLGSNLDSTLTPSSIAAAQATFVAKSQQQPQQMKPTLSGKSGENAMTPEQARTKALSKP